jgi:carboxypeptidase family protein/HYDIN/CFA65/VesB family protein
MIMKAQSLAAICATTLVCVCSVHFQPASAQPQRTTHRVIGGQLRANPFAGVLHVSVSSLTFQTVNLAGGYQSQTLSFTITNVGTSQLVVGISNPTAGTPFLIVSNGRWKVLRPSGSTIVRVQYAPSVAGQYSSQIQISSNGGSATVSLMGSVTGSLPMPSYQSSTTDAAGSVSFPSVATTVQVVDLGSQEALPGISVTLVTHANRHALLVVDPLRRFAPRFVSVTLKRGLRHSVGVDLAPGLDQSFQVGACIVSLIVDGINQLAEPQCAALTGPMWTFLVDANLITCTQTQLNNVNQQLAAAMISEFQFQLKGGAVLATLSIVGIAFPPAAVVIEPVIGAAELTVEGVSAIDRAAIALGASQTLTYELEGYALTDVFSVCGINQSIPYINLLLDDLVLVQPASMPSGTAPPPSQPGGLTGTVTTSLNGPPIQGAQVLLYGACTADTGTVAVVTGSDGSYSFGNIAPGEPCGLSVSKAGYVQSGATNFTVNTGSTLVLSVVLQPPAIFVANGPCNGPGCTGPFSLSSYPIFGNGNVQPTFSISGPNTGLNVPSGVALDGQGNTWVSNYAIGGGTPSVTEYGPGSTGNVAPINMIAGSNTTISYPVGIALDTGGNIYIANAAATILEFNNGANGNVAPNTTISGSNTGLGFIGGMAIDSLGNIWVTNGAGGGPASVTEYAAGSKGNISPVNTLAGSNTGLNFPAGIAIDMSGNIWVANQALPGTNPTCPGVTGSIVEFASNASGNTAPIATISGSSTALSNPFGVGVYPNGQIYVVNACTNAIAVFAARSNGNAMPIREIFGSNTGLNAPGATAGLFPSSMP